MWMGGGLGLMKLSLPLSSAMGGFGRVTGKAVRVITEMALRTRKAAGPRTCSWTKRRRRCWMGRAGRLNRMAADKVLLVECSEIKNRLHKLLQAKAARPVSSTVRRRAGPSAIGGVRGCPKDRVEW